MYSDSCEGIESWSVDDIAELCKDMREQLYHLKKNLARELFKAAEEGSLKVVKVIMDSTVQFDKRKLLGPNLPSYLHAWENGHEDCAKAICSGDFERFSGFESETLRDVLMRLAVDFDHFDCLETLINGGDSYGKWNGRHAYLNALTCNKIDCLGLLLEAGIGRDDFHFSQVGCVESAKLLIKHGANINSVDSEGHSALTNAVRSRRSRLSKFLLDHGAKMNPPGCTHQMLFLAIENESIDLVTHLIENGADLEAPSSFGDTPVMKASAVLNSSILELLLKHGADPNSLSSDGDTALHRITSCFDYYAFEKAWNCMAVLVEYKANPNALDGQGRTPLDIAMLQNSPGLVEMLLHNGATRSTGKSALQIARERKDSTAAVILAHFVKVRLRRLRGIIRFFIISRRYREDFYRDKYVTIGERSFTKRMQELQANDCLATDQRPNDLRHERAELSTQSPSKRPQNR